MNDNSDLLARAYHWILDLRGGGHTLICRGSQLLRPELRNTCDCGRDALLDDISKAFAAPLTTGTNGREL